MKNFEELLQKELDKLPYTKHLDDGQYNDGQIAGFELGARWALSLFAVSGSVPLSKCKCGQNTLPYKAQIEIDKCSRCGNDR